MADTAPVDFLTDVYAPILARRLEDLRARYHAAQINAKVSEDHLHFLIWQIHRFEQCLSHFNPSQLKPAPDQSARDHRPS